jgi:hypothetical protein
MDEANIKEAGDFPASPIADALPLVCNVADEVLYANIRKTIERGTPLVQACEPHEHVAILVGGGPSAEDDLEVIRDNARAGNQIFALNGAGLWLQRHGIQPDAVIILDARPHNVRFVHGLHPDIVLYLASQCDESLFEAGRSHDVVTWHPPMGGLSGIREMRATTFIGGSTTVGLRAMRLVHVLGYREVHLFGYDSSYRDGDAHAYDQHENGVDRPRECGVGNRIFVSTAWMIRQADDFRWISAGLMTEGMSVHVHGDGLLPAIAQLMTVTE